MGQNSNSSNRESEKRHSQKSGIEKSQKQIAGKIQYIKSMESSELSDQNNRGSHKDKKSKKKTKEKNRAIGDDFQNSEGAMDSTSNTGHNNNSRGKSENMVFGGSIDQYSDGLGFSNHSGQQKVAGRRDSEGMLDDKYLRSNSIVINDANLMNQSNYVHQLFDENSSGKQGKMGEKINGMGGQGAPSDMIINTKYQERTDDLIRMSIKQSSAMKDISQNSSSVSQAGLARSSVYDRRQSVLNKD